MGRLNQSETEEIEAAEEEETDELQKRMAA